MFCTFVIEPHVLKFVTRVLLSHFFCEGTEKDLPIKRHKGFWTRDDTEESLEHIISQWTLFDYQNYCAFLRLSLL